MAKASLSQRGTVAVVVTTYNDASFIPDALDSLFRQTRPADQIIVVDDGSDDDIGEVFLDFPGITLIRQANQGLAAARNTGLNAVQSEYVVFLDADDRLTECALEKGLETFADKLQAGMVYGGHRRVNDRFVPISTDRFIPVGDDPLANLLRGNVIGMHGAVIYRTAALRKIGGFNVALRQCEDYDVYLRMAREYPIGWHTATVAEYRQHGSNMSGDREAMLGAVLKVHKDHEPAPEDVNRHIAWLEGRSNWQKYYRPRTNSEKVIEPVRELFGKAKHRLKNLLDGRWPPAVGKVRMGHLNSLRPVSMDFGFDRGLPVDRYYIEAFLARNARDITGRVLEIGDDGYSRKFGAGRVTRQDILHVDAGNPATTIVGDITEGVLPAATFDCIIFTQTLQFIFDLKSAIEELYKALKPGGVLLLTVPGISQIDRGRWGQCWYWSFTQASIKRLFEPVFGTVLDVEVRGNVFAATCFLQGLATEEIDAGKLLEHDAAYPVIVGLRAKKGLE